MTQESIRVGLIAGGAALVIAVMFVVAAFVWPSRARARHVGCLPYFLVPQEKVCGRDVYLVHPNGRREWVGPTSSLAPMPKPPAKGNR